MTQEYSIWLVPDESSDAYSIFNDLISEYSQRYSDAPDFKPHVTLLGGIEKELEAVEDCAKSLTQGHQRLELEFVDVSCSVTNHQCVFLLVEPSVELLNLHQNGLQDLDRTERMFTPHLSLIYSDMPVEDRVEEVRSIETDSLPDTIEADAIEIFDTTGLVSDWEQVSTYPLLS